MLVERHDELGLLRESYADCAAGKGRVVLVSGALASGKTALLHAFAEHVVESDALLLTATGARPERTLRMGILWQLLRSTPLPADTLDRVARLIDTEPQVAEDGDTDPGTMRQADVLAVHGICAVLIGLARQRPVVIVVDDLQHADAASLRALLYLRRRIRSERLLIALSEWERPTLARPYLRAEITRQPHRRIIVTPLSPAGIAELAARRLPPEAADRLAPAYHALGGGNPFLTHALIEDQVRADDSAAPVVDGAFRHAVLDCLHRWEPEHRTVAGGLAVLGHRAGPELVAELLGLQTRSVRQAIGVLTAAGLAERGRLRHTAITGTVLESLSPGDASRLHTRAAELLYQHGVDAADVARHVVAADAVPGQWAVAVLQHAADQSVVEDAGFAVKCLELAIRVAADEPERVTLRAALVRIAWRVNPLVAEPHLAPLAEALRAGRLSWRDATPVIRHRFWQGDLDAAVADLRAVRDAAGAPDARTTAELRLAAEWFFGSLRGRLPDDVLALLAGAEAATTAPSSWARTAALNSLWTRGAGREVATAAEQILQGHLGDVLPEAGATALLALEGADRQDRAAFWCDALTEEATRQRATTWQAVLGCVQADIAWRRGDLVTAELRAGAALALLPTQSWGVLIGWPLSILILVNTAMGRYAAAAELLDRAVPEAMFGTAFGARYRHASGHYSLASGRTQAGLDDFQRCAAWSHRRDLDVPAMVPWRSDLAATLLKLGMRREAKELLSEQLGRPDAGGGSRARGMALRVLAAGSEPAERVSLLREAIQYLEWSADRLELARALADLSQVHRELGQLGSARLVLRKAEQTAKICHADILPAQPATASPDRHSRGQALRHTPTIGLAALSEAEQKVADLAAHGHTNREIGRKLCITVSTVEQHLTRVYKKLNVSRRADLLPQLSRQDGAGRELIGPESRVAMSR